MNAPLIRNAPLDPFELFKDEVDDLLLEAKNYLDGEPIQNEEQANAVSSLLSRLRRVSGDADEARKTEKKPHDDAAKAVQAKWKPIIDTANVAAETAKSALTPYLERVRAENEAREAASRQEAEEAAQRAREALAASAGDLTARIDAETLLKAAGEADKKASRLAKDKAQARGGERAVSLRTSYRAIIEDQTAFARWVWANRQPDMLQFLLELAAKECRNGPVSIPGIRVETVSKAA